MSALRSEYSRPFDPISPSPDPVRRRPSAIDCSRYSRPAIELFSGVSRSSPPSSPTRHKTYSTDTPPSLVSQVARKLLKQEPFRSLESARKKAVSARKKAVSQRHKIPTKINTSPYDLSDAKYLPGFSNVFFAPGDFFNGLKVSKESRSKKDRETKHDSALRLFQTPLAFIYGACASYVNVILLFETFLPGLISCLLFINNIFSKVTLILGLVLTLIELIVEIPGFHRSIKFSKNLMFSIEGIIKKLKETKSPHEQRRIISDLIQKFKKDKENMIKKYGYVGYSNILKTLITYKAKLHQHRFTTSDIAELETKLLYHALESFKRKYMEASPSHVRKIMESSTDITREQAEFVSKETHLKNLSKRIHQWATDRVYNDIDWVLDSLKASNPSTRKYGVKKAYELIKIMRTQNTKKIFTHYIGFIAIALSAVCLILTLILLFNPAVFPFIATALLISKIIFWASFAAGIVSGAANQGFMSCEGWHFSIKKALPEMPQCIKKLFLKLKTVSSRKPKPLSSRSIRRERCKTPFRRKFALAAPDSDFLQIS